MYHQQSLCPVRLKIDQQNPISKSETFTTSVQLIDSNNSVLIVNPVLIERDPLKVKTNGKPLSLLKKKLVVREAKFEDSTHRKSSSRFEYEGVK